MKNNSEKYTVNNDKLPNVMNWKTRCNHVEFKGACFIHHYEPQTHVHGSTPELHMESDGPIGLRYCQFPVKRTKLNIGLEFWTGPIIMQNSMLNSVRVNVLES